MSTAVTDELHLAMHSPFNFAEFERFQKFLVNGKSPGPSGLAATQIESWGPVTSKYVSDLSVTMWAHHHVLNWWQDRLVTLFPKEQGVHDL